MPIQSNEDALNSNKRILDVADMEHKYYGGQLPGDIMDNGTRTFFMPDMSGIKKRNYSKDPKTEINDARMHSYLKDKGFTYYKKDGIDYYSNDDYTVDAGKWGGKHITVNEETRFIDTIEQLEEWLYGNIKED